MMSGTSASGLGAQRHIARGSARSSAWLVVGASVMAGLIGLSAPGGLTCAASTDVLETPRHADVTMKPRDLSSQLFALQRPVWAGLDEPEASQAQFQDVLSLWPASPGQRAVILAWQAFALGEDKTPTPPPDAPSGQWTQTEIAQWQLARLASAQRLGDATDVPATLSHVKSILAPPCRERLTHPSCDAWSLWQLYHVSAQWRVTQHQWASALADWMEAQRIANDLGQPRLQGMAMAYLASAHASLGHADQALSLLDAAQRLVATDPLMRSRVAILAAWVYRTLSRTPQQLEALQQAEQTAREHHWPYVAALAHNQLADLHLHQRRPQQALAHATQADQLMPHAAPAYIQRAALHNLALSHVALGQFDQAKVLLERMSHIKAHRDDLNLRLQELRELDEFWAQAGRPKEALAAYHAERKLALQGAEEFEQDTLQQLMVQGEVELQEEALRQAQQLSDARQDALNASTRIRQLLWILGISVAAMAVITAVLLLVSRRRRRLLTHRRQQLEHLSGHDALTGLWNRARLAQSLQESGEGGAFGLWMLIDIDHFKQVNDQLGHACGDQVIQQLAAVLRQALPPQASCARWGGEEFLVHWPGAKSMEATRLIGELLEAVRRAPWPAPLQTLSASIGAVLWAPGPPGSAPAPAQWEEAVHAADLCLYGAKRHGRDQAWHWCNWTPERHAPAAHPGMTATFAANQGESAWPSGCIVLQVVDSRTPPVPLQVTQGQGR